MEFLQIKLQRIDEKTLDAIKQNDQRIAQKVYESSRKNLGRDYNEITKVRYRTEF